MAIWFHIVFVKTEIYVKKTRESEKLTIISKINSTVNVIKERKKSR